MYACVCNAICEAELRRCARVVPGDAVAVYAAMGKAPQCGQCLDDSNELIADARAGEPARAPLRLVRPCTPLHAAA